MRLSKAIFLCLLILVTSGCSIKFAYNNADRLVRWQMSDYFDLDAEQKDYLQDQVVEFMAWHRAEHLPLYADYLYDMSERAGDGVSERQIQEMFQQLLLWGKDVEDRGMPAAIHLLTSLSDEQVAALPAKLEKSNLDITEQDLDLSVEQIQSRWAEDFEDALERFTGRLGYEQRAYLGRRATAYQPENLLWAGYRRRWQAEMLRLLKDRNDVETFDRGFRQLVTARESYYGPVYKRLSDDNIALSREVASYLLSNLTEKQSERFVDTLRQWAEDFEELAGPV
jgi:hypothetical protein